MAITKGSFPVPEQPSINNNNSTGVMSKLNYKLEEIHEIVASMDEVSEILEKVSRIKTVIKKSNECPPSAVIASLKLLSGIPMSVEILKATAIGRAVNALTKNRSLLPSEKKIQHLAQTLISSWKGLVDEFLSDVSSSVDGRQQQQQQQLEEEEDAGLPCPPMDDLGFFMDPSIAAADFGLSVDSFFDGIDDEIPLNKTEEECRKGSAQEKKKITHLSIDDHSPCKTTTTATTTITTSLSPADSKIMVSHDHSVYGRSSTADSTAWSDDQRNKQRSKLNKAAAVFQDNKKPVVFVAAAKKRDIKKSASNKPPVAAAAAVPKRQVGRGKDLDHVKRIMSRSSDDHVGKRQGSNGDFNKKESNPVQKKKKNMIISATTAAQVLNNKHQQQQQEQQQQRNSANSRLTALVDNKNQLKAKLESSKRKLHDRYQEIENAKKQKRIRLLETKNLPRLPPGMKNIAKAKSSTTTRWITCKH